MREGSLGEWLDAAMGESSNTSIAKPSPLRLIGKIVSQLTPILKMPKPRSGRDRVMGEYLTLLLRALAILRYTKTQVSFLLP